MVTKKDIGKNLQRLRKNGGYSSAKAYAEHMGYNPNTYTQYEQGLISISYERAWEIADDLGCTLDDIGGRKPPRIYADPNQQRLNDCFENMNEKGQATLVSVAQGLEKDIANRIVKEGQEYLADQQGA